MGVCMCWCSYAKGPTYLINSIPGGLFLITLSLSLSLFSQLATTRLEFKTTRREQKASISRFRATGGLRGCVTSPSLLSSLPLSFRYPSLPFTHLLTNKPIPSHICALKGDECVQACVCVCGWLHVRVSAWPDNSRRRRSNKKIIFCFT